MTLLLWFVEIQFYNLKYKQILWKKNLLKKSYLNLKQKPGSFKDNLTSTNSWIKFALLVSICSIYLLNESNIGRYNNED